MVSLDRTEQKPMLLNNAV